MALDIATLGAFVLLFFIIFLFGSIALYVYISFAYMKLAKKTNKERAGIAWIPLIGPAIIASKIAKRHWWPILLFISGIILGFISSLISIMSIRSESSVVGFVVSFIINLIVITLIIAFYVFFLIWNWFTFEAVGRPGWWALTPLSLILSIIPLIGLFLSLIGSIAFLVLLGIAAFGNSKKSISNQEYE